jgi:regulatory protein
MQKGVAKDLIATTLTNAYDNVDEATLAREYIARKRMKQPSGPDTRKETVRTMNRLIRAGFSSAAIFKVLRDWGAPVEEIAELEIEEPAADA